MKCLQMVVNGPILGDAINTERRQKLLKVNKLLQDKCENCTSVYFLQPDKDWTGQNGQLNKIYCDKDNLHLILSKTERRNWHYQFKQN